MDFRTAQWCPAMLEALGNAEFRDLAWKQLPRIVDQSEPLGPLSPSMALDAGVRKAPLIFPTSDDQQAGLVGGGAVDDGQMAVILGNSAVVNSSSARLPQSGSLDAMRLNWGPFLWMRCYNNGANSSTELSARSRTGTNWRARPARSRPAAAVSRSCHSHHQSHRWA